MAAKDQQYNISIINCSWFKNPFGGDVELYGNKNVKLWTIYVQFCTRESTETAAYLYRTQCPLLTDISESYTVKATANYLYSVLATQLLLSPIYEFLRDWIRTQNAAIDALPPVPLE
jgi:hypothetical protein